MIDAFNIKKLSQASKLHSKSRKALGRLSLCNNYFVPNK